MSRPTVQWSLRSGWIALSTATAICYEALSSVRSEVQEDARLLSSWLGRPIEIRSNRGELLATVDGRPS